MPASVDEILQAYARLKTQRSPWESTWQAIADTCLPAHNDIQSVRVPGQTRTTHVYDTTGMHALSLLASHIAGGITNFQTRFLGLRMSYEPLNEVKAVSIWLESCATIMHERMASTTTPKAFQEKYRQFPAFGTGALFADRVPLGLASGAHGLMARSLPVGTYYLAEDATGAVDTVYRELELSPRQAIQHFGVDAVHEDVRNADQRQETRHTPGLYLHCVYPRTDRDPRLENQRNMPYASVYVDVRHKHVVSEGGYRWLPYMVTRWEKLRSWSPYGFGPGHIALPEILTLNRMDMDVLKALQIHILPPYWTDDPDAVGRVLLLPGFVNPIAKGSQIQPMRGPGDFNISHLGMEERRQRIRQAFYMDQLLTLPPPDASGRMTAFEVGQRIAFMQRLMGPALMALLSEFLNPFVDIQFGMMLEDGELPDPPDVVILAALAGQGKITVDYLGPLVRAQRGEEVTAIEGTLSLAERIFAVQQDPSIITDHFDVGELLRVAAKVYGVPPSVVWDKAETAKRQQARAQAQHEAAQVEGMRDDVKALGPAAQMVKALAPAQGGTAA